MLLFSFHNKYNYVPEKNQPKVKIRIAMKTSLKNPELLFLMMIFLMFNNVTFAQSVYREPAKDTKKPATTSSTKTDSNSTSSKNDDDMILWYSMLSSSNEKSTDTKTAEKSFYTVKELTTTQEDASRKFKVFEKAFGGQSSVPEKLKLAQDIKKIYQTAASQVDKAYATKSSYSESDQKTILAYKEHYSNVLGFLNELIDFAK